MIIEIALGYIMGKVVYDFYIYDWMTKNFFVYKQKIIQPIKKLLGGK